MSLVTNTRSGSMGSQEMAPRRVSAGAVADTYIGGIDMRDSNRPFGLVGAES